MMRLYLILTLLLLTGCSATDMSEPLALNTGGIPKNELSTARTVEAIRKLRPQAQIPIKVAVMLTNRRTAFTIDERELISTWGDKLKTLGFIKSLDIIPQSFMPQCGYKADSDCYVSGSRLAGARMGADAILFLNDSTVTDTYASFLGFLNLTIVGLWVIPTEHRDSYSVYEAALIDINNGYVYAVAEEKAEYKVLRPKMLNDQTSEQNAARVAALNKVGQKLYEMAQEKMSQSH